MGMIVPNIKPDLDALRTDVAIAALRDVVKDGWSVMALSTGMADAFVDSTGISALGGATYDGTNKLINNGGGGYSSNLIPNMTGYSAPSGTASALNDGNSAAWKAFDGNSATGFASTDLTMPAFLQYQFPTGKIVSKYTIYGPKDAGYEGRSPNSWQFQGSNNGSAWTTLDTQSGVSSWTVGTPKSYTFSNSTSFTYYRLYVTAANSGPTDWQVCELQMFASLAPQAITTVSAAFALGFQPSQARIVCPVELESGVLGTDCMLDLGRDGVTWSNVPLTDLGKFDSNTRIVGGLVSLADQPAGSSIYWRWRTSGAYTIKNHGVWIQAK